MNSAWLNGERRSTSVGYSLTIELICRFAVLHGITRSRQGDQEFLSFHVYAKVIRDRTLSFLRAAVAPLSCIKNLKEELELFRQGVQRAL